MTSIYEGPNVAATYNLAEKLSVRSLFYWFSHDLIVETHQQHSF